MIEKRHFEKVGDTLVMHLTNTIEVIMMMMMMMMMTKLM